jgi:hypothetical protein
MINIALSSLQQVAAHFVGNNANGDPLKLSEGPFELHDDNLIGLLRSYFLGSFNTPEFYSFTFSNEDFTLNPLYRFASDIFNDPYSLFNNSINIAKHLFGATQHPNIKAGELYVAYVKGIEVDGILYDGVGIFKSENKENYLKLTRDFELYTDEGTNVRKLDKGCLILDTERESGFKVMIVDNVNKSDAYFWKHDFLNVKPQSDAFHHTSNFMNMTRQFVSEQLSEEFNVSKAEKIDLLNRSVEFFKSNEEFSKAEFETSVLGDADVIESFRNYNKNFMAENEFDAVDQFEISVQAVKRQAKVFKTVLKLDKNFHIYIHGSRELIEKGFDEVQGKHYYKLYFDSES